MGTIGSLMMKSVWAYGRCGIGVDGSVAAGGRNAPWLISKDMGTGSSAWINEPNIRNAIKIRAMPWT